MSHGGRAGTLEVLLLLFPNDFMLIAGLRNTVQSASGFLTFVVLPAIANAVAREGDGNYDDGTTVSLYVLGWVSPSLCAHIDVWV